MEHPRTGFLEGLYAGTRGVRGLPPFTPSADEGKIAGISARVREAVKGYDPAALEAMHTVPPELMQKLRETGIFGSLIPEAYGGLGFSLTEYLRAIEELAGVDLSLAIIPLAHLSIGVKAILLFGTDDQKRRYLPRAASGEIVFAYALTEPDTGSDARHIRTSAERCADGSFVLSGTKTFITNANYAGALTVFAQTDPASPGRLAAFVVERGWDGVSVGRDMPKMGLGVSSTAAVHLRKVHVPRENLIGELGDGFRIAMTVLNYGRLGLGAASAGLMKRSLRDMEKRSSTRTQFGSPIRDFELIQEKLVDARAHSFAAAAMTYATAAMLERDPLMNVAVESSHCKLYGTTRCWDTLNDALQTAGGSGYLSSLPYEKRVRDFRVTTIFEGTTEIHSVYPALAVLRSLGTRLSGMGAAGKLALLARTSRAVSLGSGGEKDPHLLSAIRTAVRSERLFRRLLVLALRRFGRSVEKEEYYLRRMTNLSLSLFWLVASVAWIKGRHPDSRYPPEELDVLDYLSAETRETQERSRVFGNTEKEKVSRRISSRLSRAP